jgi:hypothetical protein
MAMASLMLEAEREVCLGGVSRVDGCKGFSYIFWIVSYR